MDLEGNNSVQLTDLLTLKSGNWRVTDNNNTYYYLDSNATGDFNVSTITFNINNRTVSVEINCTSFTDEKTQKICTEDLNQSTYSQTIRF